MTGSGKTEVIQKIDRARRKTRDPEMLDALDAARDYIILAKATQAVSHVSQTPVSQPKVANNKRRDRKAYMRDYMRNRRKGTR